MVADKSSFYNDCTFTIPFYTKFHSKFSKKKRKFKYAQPTLVNSKFGRIIGTAMLKCLAWLQDLHKILCVIKYANESDAAQLSTATGDWYNPYKNKWHDANSWP